MNCDKVREWMSIYWDLPDNDLRRKSVDDHIATCPSCAEEFEAWRESREWIQQAGSSEPPDTLSDSASVPVARKVMSRIYEEESWRQPVAERIYSLSYKLRRTLTIVLSFCMALFVVSFVHSVIQRNSPAADMSMYADLSGPVPVASAVAGSADVGMFDTMQGMPVASISDPLIVRVQHVPTDPDYFLVFSVLGMAMTLMIINWFTRIRS